MVVSELSPKFGWLTQWHGLWVKACECGLFSSLLNSRPGWVRDGVKGFLPTCVFRRESVGRKDGDFCKGFLTWWYAQERSYGCGIQTLRCPSRRTLVSAGSSNYLRCLDSRWCIRAAWEDRNNGGGGLTTDGAGVGDDAFFRHRASADPGRNGVRFW